MLLKAQGKIYRILICCLVFGLSIRAEAQDSYVRKDKDLEIAITRFTLPQGSQVALVGAIHIADAEYYQQIQKELSASNLVLFELVTDVAVDRLQSRTVRSNSAIGGFQRQLANYLGLAYQLDSIDYTKLNMLRADMTQDQLAKVMAERDEGFMKLYLKTLGMQATETSTGAADFAMLLFPGTRKLQLRKMLAQEFSDLDQFLDAFNGGENIALISARNDVALHSLRTAITKLPSGEHQKIAIFYGAAHMRDMEKKLVANFGAVKEKTDWLTAWKL